MSDIEWGAKAIGRTIGRKPRQVYHLWSRGHLKSVRQVGNLLVGSRTALLKEFGGDAAAASAPATGGDASAPATGSEINVPA